MDVPSSSSTAQPVKISFGVKKKLETKVEVVNVVVADESDHSDDEAEIAAKRRKLTHFENGVLAGDDEEDSRKKKKETMVIPLVKEHDWRVAKLLEMEKNGTISDEDRARLAILTEGQPFSISTTETEEVSLSVSVEVGATVKEVEDADYGQIPIESYGLAILRGCGWKDGEGIGKNPQVVPLRVSQQRPKGLGLGAKPPKQEKKQAHNKQEEEELSGDVKQGSKVKITVKPHIGKYGVVEGRDDDNNSCFVRLALGNAKVRVSLFCVQKVTTKEYEKNAKVLNQANYEQEAKRLEVERESYRDKEKDRRNGETKNGKGRLEDDDDIIIEDVRDRRELWARPDLIVRFVNPDYKKGRYMSQKMRVVDVADYKNLTLEDDDRKQHYQIKQSWIETVIPRSAGERVMIVRGKGRGQPAVMEAKNKDLQKCVVRIVHSEEVLRVPFDDLCMWTPSTHYDSDQ